MAYCRFENTQRDLEECRDALVDLMDQNVEDELNDDSDGLSKSEAMSMLALRDTAVDLLELLGYEVEAPDTAVDTLEDLENHFPQLCGFKR